MTPFTSPLKVLAVGESQLLACRGLDLYLCDHALNPSRRVATIPRSRTYRAATRVRLVQRLLRAEPTDAVFLTDSSALINFRNEVWRLDLQTSELTLDFPIPHGRKALRLSLIRGVNGIGDGVYLGEYCVNPGKSAISVWFRSDATAQWTRVHEFPTGAINHVHGVFGDTHRQCAWILTGDFGDAAAIWLATDDFSQVHAVLRGEQDHRATWMYCQPHCIYFATDSQLEPNKLLKLTFDSGNPRLEFLASLPGSSIYGDQSIDAFYFSTAVEPGYPPRNRVSAFLDRKPGPAILGNASCVYALSPDGSFRKVLSAEKDAWPMLPFQFGTFQVRASPGGGAYVHGTGLKGHDGQTSLV